MRQAQKRTRRKKCVSCLELFHPDARTKGKQRYCSKDECQRQRQRKNERDWRRRYPACVEYHQQKSSVWYKAHPRYSSQRRSDDAELLVRNRDQTRLRMRKIRQKRMFDKSKVIFTQLTGNKRDKCYLTHGGKGLFVCLTKARSLTYAGALRDNRGIFKRTANRLPKGRLYDLSRLRQ
jgi:hypothetical protein